MHLEFVINYIKGLTIITIGIIINETKEAEVNLKTELVRLASWIDDQYKSYPSIPPRQQKEEVAHELECGVATLYRWLKEDSTYIEQVGPSICGDDGGIIVWQVKRSLFE